MLTDNEAGVGHSSWVDGSNGDIVLPSRKKTIIQCQILSPPVSFSVTAPYEALKAVKGSTSSELASSAKLSTYLSTSNSGQGEGVCQVKNFHN